MKNQHTPGPWEMKTDLVNGDEVGGSLQEANARLIAAAPDLLDACREVGE